MEDSKKISSAVIRRLPRYYRYLGELIESGVQRISSKDLSTKMKVTASQIRQDLNNFGGFGLLCRQTGSVPNLRRTTAFTTWKPPTMSTSAASGCGDLMRNGLQNCRTRTAYFNGFKTNACEIRDDFRHRSNAMHRPVIHQRVKLLH